MDGLTFSTVSPVTIDPVRVDVTCFIGYLGRRSARRSASTPGDTSTETPTAPSLPNWLRVWLKEANWQPGQAARTEHDLTTLLNVPVPIDNWETFDTLFAWDQRPVASDDNRYADTWMGAAVRRFFAQGGRRCYIIRLGNPWPIPTPEPERLSRTGDYLSTLPAPSPLDRETWRGIGHLLGLPEVSFLCLPDLPEIFAASAVAVAATSPLNTPERFIECADPAPPDPTRRLRGFPAPRCDARGFWSWSLFVRQVAVFLERNRPDTQFIVSVPLPVQGDAAAMDPASARISRKAQEAQWEEARAIHSRSVQLVYPWLRTREANRLPGQLEPPDSMLTGILANNALTRGTWRSLIHQPLSGIESLEPVPDRALLNQAFLPRTQTRGTSPASVLRNRVTLLGPAHQGFRLLSDVTTAAGFHRAPEQDQAYNPANVNRLLAALMRTATRLGESVVFENNGERLWRQLHDALEGFLIGVWAQGALAGASAQEAFEVRCDRSTMTQNDLDSGRVVARISFRAAMPIVHITVLLSVMDGGQVSLLSNRAGNASTASPQDA